MRHPLLLVLPPLLLTIAGCAAAPETAAPAPPPVAVPLPPAPPPVVAWEDRPLSAGGWRYARAAAGSTATFGAGLASLACRPAARSVTLSVAPSVPGAAGTATIRTTSATRQVALSAEGGAAFAATDPLLDAMAFSRGRFTVEVAGRAPLVLPAHAEIGRVIEDCRG